MQEKFSAPHQPTPMMRVLHLSKLFRNQLRSASEEEGVPWSYRSILIELSQSEKLTQYELAKRTHLTPPTVSVTLQKMEHDGYITRTPDEKDLRQMKVALTPKGIETELANRARADALEQKILNGFSDEDLEKLAQLLTHMESNLNDAVGFPQTNTEKGNNT